jgi:hypothetical protein
MAEEELVAVPAEMAVIAWAMALDGVVLASPRAASAS